MSEIESVKGPKTKKKIIESYTSLDGTKEITVYRIGKVITAVATPKQEDFDKQ